MPEFIQLLLVSQRIHRLPEIVVVIRMETLLTGQLLQRFAFPHDCGIIGYGCQYFRREYKEATIDPAAIPGRLLLKSAHLGSFGVE